MIPKAQHTAIPPQEATQPRLWRFADCEFDELSRQLRVRGISVELESKPLDVLLYLLLHPGQVVSKEELLAGVWSGLLVVDGSLATAISKLRRALGDSDATIIVTIPRVGYRLGVPASFIPTPHPQLNGHSQPPSIEASLSQQASVTTPDQPFVKPPRPIWITLAATVTALGLLVVVWFLLKGRPEAAKPAPRSVAVLPFHNSGTDHTLDYLSIALADEVATALSNEHFISVRPFASSEKFTQQNPDLQRIEDELKVSSIVTGHFFRQGDQIQFTLEAIDVQTNRLLWRDTLSVPVNNMLATRAAIVSRSQGPLAAALGASSTPGKTSPPTNEEAYNLYLRSLSFPSDPDPSRQARIMLERSVELDPDFAPAWLMLAKRYYVESRYQSGHDDMMLRYEAAMQRSHALDPSYIPAAAGLSSYHTERGELKKAFNEAQDLIRLRPDSADAHYALSYVLRYAGLLEPAAAQCDIAMLLDPHTQTSGLRSCAVVFLLSGDYPRAMEYIHLDPANSNWLKAMSIHTLLREGRQDEAVKIAPARIPQWTSFDMLLACAQHRPSAEIAATASSIQPADDPETNYFAASHLAYCGQTEAARAILQKAIDGNYCSYPAIDNDPFFTDLRKSIAYPALRQSAIACQKKFIATRDSR